MLKFFKVLATLIALSVGIGVCIYGGVFAKDEPTRLDFKSSEEYESETEFPIDINEATAEQLMEIDGIGEVLAQRIVDYIAENGRLNSIDELLNVEGIGEQKLEKIREFVYVEGEQTSAEDTSPAPKTTTAPCVTTKPQTVTSKELTTTTAKTTTFSAEPAEIASAQEKKTRHTVNINTATAQEIEDGLLLTAEEAQAIVQLREEIGGYSTIYEILMITKENSSSQLFTHEKFNEFKDFIVVE